MSMSNVMWPRMQRIMRMSLWFAVATLPAGGMKSSTSPIPASVVNRVMSTAVSGKYICRDS
jgi:hypothetical protein